MTWIKTIPIDEAVGKLRRLYERIKSPSGDVDNIMVAHSLRPHTMDGHMALYKNVLHHSGNTVDRWFLEALGVLTSLRNECPYCVEHHLAGMTRLLDDANRAERIRKELESGVFGDEFDERQKTALQYAEQLTVAAASVKESDIRTLRDTGWSDGEILEINQVVAYFNYANRTVLGLGVSTKGEVLGLSPSATRHPEDWSHR